MLNNQTETKDVQALGKTQPPKTASDEQVCFSRPSGIVLVAVAVAGRLLLLGHFRDCGIGGDGDGGKDVFF